MAASTHLQMTLLPGARELLAAHARELPQRDDLCGAFCGALALRAAGIAERDGELLDQDAVAIAAGSVVAGEREAGVLPGGERGRRDYRLEIPSIEDPGRSGTTAAGLVAAIAALGAGELAAIPLRGPWTARTLDGIFELSAALQHPVSLIANLATGHLWGGRASILELLDHLCAGSGQGPPPDWHVGHFACVVGRVAGPRGTLYALADTYPSLGNDGVHMQPAERLAEALERPEGPGGGMIVVAKSEDAPRVRGGGGALGLTEAIWDNGTVTEASPA